MSESLPLVIKMPWYRRFLFGFVCVFMLLMGFGPLLIGGQPQSFGLYVVAGFFALTGITGLVMLTLAPKESLIADEEGIVLAYMRNPTLRKKILWSDIVRIEAVRVGRQELLAIESKTDLGKASQEKNFVTSALWSVFGRLVMGGNPVGVYVPGLWLPSVKKTAQRLNDIHITKHNHV